MNLGWRGSDLREGVQGVQGRQARILFSKVHGGVFVRGPGSPRLRRG